MKLKLFFLYLIYFSSIFTFDKNINAEDLKNVPYEKHFYYLGGRVQVYCQLHSVGHLSKKNAKIWIDHSFKLSKDGGMKKQDIKTLREFYKKQFPYCPM